MSGSRDGEKSWSEPRFLLGSYALKCSAKPQASWGFPIVSRSGRIYLFYFREVVGEVDNTRQLTAAFACIYSDDNGDHWRESRDIPLPRTPYDRQANVQDNIVFQLPMRCADGMGYGIELAIYGSMTFRGGKKILWYPDRKFFLLGKDIE